VRPAGLPEPVGITRRGWLAVAVMVLVEAAIVWVAIALGGGEANAVEAPRNPLASLAPWHADIAEPATERAERLDLAKAEAVARAEEEERWQGSRRMLAALVLSIGWHETRFARVAPVACPTPGGCDRGRAWHYYQTHTVDEMREDGWLGLSVATREAIRVLRQGAAHCGGSGRDRLLGAVSIYATGKTCHWSGADERVRLAERIVRRL
jgi:hypothetical protein